MKLQFTQSFQKEYKKCIKGKAHLEQKISKQLNLLLIQPKQPSLRLHKLQHSEYWSISIDTSIRVLCLFQKEVIVLYHIGTHDEVY